MGALYTYHRWQGSLTWKQVGSQVVFDGAAAPGTAAPIWAGLAPNQEAEIPAYSVINATAGYDFGHFKVKVAVYNLADHRSITSVSGPTETNDYYTFQSGRSVMGTLEAKF